MRALIVEDENAAAINLKTILANQPQQIEVVAITESVVETVDFLNDNSSSIDIIFMDIHLADGDAFKIFERIQVDVPIIFTTAYDQYALDAFKVSSIDYLLKPIKPSEVERAMEKLRQLTTQELPQYNERLRQVGDTRSELMRSLLVQVKDKIIPLKLEDIAFFYTLNERVSAYTLSGENYPVSKSLDSIMAQLEPERFFRANRQFIVSRLAIRDVSLWFGSRLRLNLSCPPPEMVIISKARTPEFRNWLR